MTSFRMAIGVISVFLLAHAPLCGHDFAVTEVLIILKTDRTYQVDLKMNVDALVLGAEHDADPAETRAALEKLPAEDLEQSLDLAGQTTAVRARVRFDGEGQWPEVTFPGRGTSPATRLMGNTVRLTGPVPQGAVEVTFELLRVLDTVHLRIVDRTTGAEMSYLLGIGEESPPFRIGEPTPPLSRLEVGKHYVVLGFEHILPKGLDHILFVLGLFLLSTKLGPLLWQITAFTVAHTASLALSMYGIVALPSRLVESLIALSIAYVGIENLTTKELKPWRPALVFGFGLLHGMGFAEVLRALGLPGGEFATALVGFNVGVELGQLAIVLIAFVTVGWFRERESYRKVVVIPASLAIAMVGGYWALTRALGWG